MTKEKFLELLNEASTCGIYKALYQRRPEAFEMPIRSWEEFCARFTRGGTRKRRSRKRHPRRLQIF